jgi:hypothetical protein
MEDNIEATNNGVAKALIWEGGFTTGTPAYFQGGSIAISFLGIHMVMRLQQQDGRANQDQHRCREWLCTSKP